MRGEEAAVGAGVAGGEEDGGGGLDAFPSAPDDASGAVEDGAAEDEAEMILSGSFGEAELA